MKNKSANENHDTNTKLNNSILLNSFSSLQLSKMNINSSFDFSNQEEFNENQTLSRFLREDTTILFQGSQDANKMNIV